MNEALKWSFLAKQVFAEKEKILDFETASSMMLDFD